MRKVGYKNLSVVFACLLMGQLMAQDFSTLNRRYLLPYEQLVHQGNNTIHTGQRPYLNFAQTADTNEAYHNDERKCYYVVTQKLFKESFIELEGEDFKIQADVVLDLMGGREFEDTTGSTRYWNTRGYWVRGNVGGVYFTTRFFENQARFPTYLSERFNRTGAVEGQGRFKAFDVTGFDFSSAMGSISIQPAAWLNLRMGHGKHFVGYGYRSLFLSDLATSYPYVRYQLRLLKGSLEYSGTYAVLTHLERMPYFTTPEAIFKRKVATFNVLSWKPTSNVELGVSEAVWQKRVAGDRTIRPRLEAYSPVIFTNTLWHGLQDSIQVLTSLMARVQAFPALSVYSQVLLDASPEKWGFQVGVRWYDVFAVQNLMLQLEYNTTSAYTYMGTDAIDAFVHHGDELAHPLGAGFKEYISLLNYRRNSWFLEIQNSFYRQNWAAGNANAGSRIALNDLMRETDPGEKKTYFNRVRVGYQLNPKSNLCLTLGYINRVEYELGDRKQMNYLQFGLRTAIQNRYYDY